MIRLFPALVGTMLLAAVFSTSAELPQKQKRSPVTKQNLDKVEAECYRDNLNPIALRLPLMAYPSAAWRKKIGGKVVVKVYINESGAVYYATALEGPPSLRKAALSSARAATFAPFTKEDKAIKCVGLLHYTFNPPK